MILTVDNATLANAAENPLLHQKLVRFIRESGFTPDDATKVNDGFYFKMEIIA